MVIFRCAGFLVSIALVLSAYTLWMGKWLPQFAIFGEEPSSLIKQWLQVLVSMGIFGSAVLIIIGISALIWKPWKK